MYPPAFGFGSTRLRHTRVAYMTCVALQELSMSFGIASERGSPSHSSLTLHTHFQNSRVPDRRIRASESAVPAGTWLISARNWLAALATAQATSIPTPHLVHAALSSPSSLSSSPSSHRRLCGVSIDASASYKERNLRSLPFHSTTIISVDPGHLNPLLGSG